MDYLELLAKVRDAGEKQAEAKKRLMMAGKSSPLNTEAVRCKNQYMRCTHAYEDLRDQAFEMMHHSEDSEVMRALFLLQR